MGLVKNYHGLLIARIFLGVTEADLYPGVAYFLTMFEFYDLPDIETQTARQSTIDRDWQCTFHSGIVPMNLRFAKVFTSVLRACLAPSLVCLRMRFPR